jgi:TRAP-type mannitol/chloroaromatic compound transport system permease small subunit
MPQLDPVARLARRLGVGLSWCFALVVVLTAYEVVMRYVFNRPTIWVHDTTIALSAICFVVGGAYALQADIHIRINVLAELLPAQARRWIDFFCHVAAFIFLAALTYAATIQASRSVALMETSGRAWDVPIPALLKTVLAAGTALMTVQALLLAWASLRRRHESSPQ